MGSSRIVINKLFRSRSRSSLWLFKRSIYEIHFSWAVLIIPIWKESVTATKIIRPKLPELANHWIVRTQLKKFEAIGDALGKSSSSPIHTVFTHYSELFLFSTQVHMRKPNPTAVTPDRYSDHALGLLYRACGWLSYYPACFRLEDS